MTTRPDHESFATRRRNDSVVTLADVVDIEIHEFAELPILVDVDEVIR